MYLSCGIQHDCHGGRDYSNNGTHKQAVHICNIKISNERHPGGSQTSYIIYVLYFRIVQVIVQYTYKSNVIFVLTSLSLFIFFLCSLF